MNGQGKPRSVRRVFQLVLCLLCIAIPIAWYYTSVPQETVPQEPSNDIPITPSESESETVTDEDNPEVRQPPTSFPDTKPTEDTKPPEKDNNGQSPTPKPPKPTKVPVYPREPVADLPVLFFPLDSNPKDYEENKLFHLEPPKPQESSEIELECPSVKVPKISKLRQSHLPTIAYSIVVHKRPDLLRVWMHLMHDPDNFYMIHVDAKAPDDVYDDIVKLSNEYDNVEINPERYFTIYYGWSVLWNHISNFMRIKQLGEDRDYYINVSGMELPIQTRKQIRFFLGEHEPASFVNEYCTISEIRNYWVAWTWAEVKAGLVVVNKEARALPAGIKLHYGSQHSILHHNIVDWMIEDLQMLHLIYWLRNTKSPEDIFFVTAARSSPWKNTVFLFNNMKYVETNHCCTGFQPSKSTPCSLGVCDMERIRASASLFLSRVDSADDPEVIPYVIELLSKREEEEEKTGKVKRLPMVKGQVLDPEYAPLPDF